MYNNSESQGKTRLTWMSHKFYNFHYAILFRSIAYNLESNYIHVSLFFHVMISTFFEKYNLLKNSHIFFNFFPNTQKYWGGGG